jgi:hypothetical protein
LQYLLTGRANSRLVPEPFEDTAPHGDGLLFRFFRRFAGSFLCRPLPFGRFKACPELVAPFVPARKTAPISAIGYVDRITAEHYPFLSQFASEIRVAGQKQPVQDLGYSLRSAFRTMIGAILHIEASP